LVRTEAQDVPVLAVESRDAAPGVTQRSAQVVFLSFQENGAAIIEHMPADTTPAATAFIRRFMPVRAEWPQSFEVSELAAAQLLARQLVRK